MPVLFQELAFHRIRRVRVAEAVQAATARVHGITTMVSTDAVFDAAPDLTRIDSREI